MGKIRSSLLWGATAATLSLSSFAFAESNTSMGSKVGVPFDTCKPEKGVKFRGTDASKATSKEMEKMLIDNTLLSVDRYGTFAIY
jgi:hypothetical protein